MVHSGKYIIREFYGFKPDTNLIFEAEEQNKPIIMSGILQKANTLNRNGRVYPYDILRREATNYMKLVEEGLAGGECVPAGTEIFTKNGWIKIEDAVKGDEIFTLDYKKNLLEIQPVTHTIKKMYNDQMVHIYNSKNLDMMVTKKHKIVLWDRNDIPYVLTAEELYDKIKQKDSKISHSYIKGFDSVKKDLLKYYNKTTIKHSLAFNITNAELVNFNDNVYCVSVPNKTWLMKYNGSISFTHNCDHPDCQTSDSQILTKNGWKYLPDISDDEEILTLNIKTGKVEVQKIDKKINVPYKGDMYTFKGNGIDIITTPNHRFLVQNKEGELKYYTAEELSKINKKHLKLLKKAVWDGVSYEKIKIDAVENESLPNNLRKVLLSKYTKDLQIDAEWFFKFMGFYLADGNAFGVMGGKSRKGYLIQITQKKQNTIPIIREILKNLTPEIKWKEITQKTGTVRFVANDARLYRYLFKLGKSSEKYIPTELKQASPFLLNLLFQTFLLGDGKSTRRNYFKDDTKTLRHTVFSTSKRLIEDLQEILIKSGGCGNITQIQPKDRIITDTIFTEDTIENNDGTISLIEKQIKRKRLILAKNSHTQYFLNVSITDFTNLDRVQIEKIDFNDNVYCVRVKNGNFYTMRNGKPFWTGNSAIVSLSNTSHRILDMWWQGEELYGKIMIAYTPAGDILKGLLKTGFKLGISSRGVGSVKSIKNEDVVQDDFELIAFDFVSSPSTPGAYMFKESRQWGLTPITEDQYKRIKCENGICRLITSDKDEKIIIPENKQIITQSTCNIDDLCNGYKKLYNLSNEEFWKKI